MSSPAQLLAAIAVFVGGLSALAWWAHRRRGRASEPFGGGLVYALALAVYCTSWTYYGSVGSAARDGPLFAAVYLGPTLGVLLWPTVLRKMIRVSRLVRVTSIADFLAARYGNSQLVAAVVTGIALIGILPYIALQHEAVTTTFSILTGGDRGGWWDLDHVGLLVALLLIGFTILTGARRARLSERDDGLMTAVAGASLLKLAAFLAAGVFVTYGVFDGFGDIMPRLETAPELAPLRDAAPPLATWVTYLVLSMSAVVLLPRQFHVGVVENRRTADLRTAMWAFPLYMLAINVFVVPIAAGGLLHGLPAERADSFVLALPQRLGPAWLALLVFVGGFAAASSMIVVSSVSMANMATNHLLLPLAGSHRRLGFLCRRLLPARWLAIAAFNLGGYVYARAVGDAYTLVNMGMLSFTAALQFAPPVVAGLYWRGASRAGALAGLGGGFAVWVYCLLLPSLTKGGWMSDAWLRHGPAGISALHPERLLGLSALDPVSHAVFWTMAANVGLLVVGSLWRPPARREIQQAELFTDGRAGLAPADPRRRLAADIPLAAKLDVLRRTLEDYLSRDEAARALAAARDAAGLAPGADDRDGERRVTVAELAALVREVEALLADLVGTATAGHVLRTSGVYGAPERDALSRMYSDLLAELNVGPQELARRVDYYKERERLRDEHAEELERQVRARTRELESTLERLQQAQAELVQAEKMASIGQLAAGIAHEINTPMGYITSNLNRLGEYAEDLGRALARQKRLLAGLDEGAVDARELASALLAVHDEHDLAFILEDLPDLVEESLDGARRIRETVGELRDFSHAGGGAPDTADLHGIIDRALKLSHAEWKRKAEIVRRHGELPPIRCHADRLGQVFINLLVNAAQAIADRGTITITTGHAGGGVWAEIADTGCGIAPEHAAKVFDPFYTTKDVGSGTGLGLHISHNIVRAHGGEITVASEQGAGTTFRVELPVDGAGDDAATDAAGRVPVEEPAG